MKPLGDAFIKLIKMLIAPIIFCTVVHGIASMEDMKKVGRVGLKALVYFEVMTTIALVIGLVVVNLWQPGAGMNVDPATLDTKAIADLHRQGRRAEHGRVPAAHHPGHRGRRLRRGRDPAGAVLRHPVRLRAALRWASAASRCSQLIDQTAHVFFGIVGIIMKVAPIGAFGAMAFTIGKYGVGTLLSLGSLMLGFYATCLIFVFGVLGLVAGCAASASSSSSATSRRSC